MLPMKKRLAIQEPRKRSIWIGSSAVVPFIILGIATLEKESQPPTMEAPKETPIAASTWDQHLISGATMVGWRHLWQKVWSVDNFHFLFHILNLGLFFGRL